MTGFILLDTSCCGEEFRWLSSISTIYDKGKEKWVPQRLSGKESTTMGRHRFDPWVKKILWRRKWQTLPVSCLENPKDRGAWRAAFMELKKLDTT